MDQKSKTIIVGGLELGSDQPERIIVPIIAENYESVLKQAEKITHSAADMVEWRLDYLQSDLSDFDTLVGTAIDLKSTLGDIPIIATSRTVKEGGEFDYPGTIYVDAYNQLIQAEIVDAIDVEFSREDVEIGQLRSLTTNGDVTMIMSHHDFEKTPEKNELIFLMSQMAKANPDIIKVAVMPKYREDVMNLMDATIAADNQVTQPLLTMSMGDLGKISRVAGKTFGSVATFGSVGKSSAPGQLSAGELKTILDTL